MSRNYTQKPSSNAPWDWTDHRVQQIMKKYEQPSPAPSPIAERTPLRNRNSNHLEDSDRSNRSPWKNTLHYKPNRQDCITPTQNKTFDLFSKENSYERSDARNSYGRTIEIDRIEKRNNYGKQPTTSIYDRTPSRESELLDAKNYLREQERKYLKIDIPVREENNYRQRDEGNYRQREREREKQREESNWRERECNIWRQRQVPSWKQRQRQSSRTQKLKSDFIEPSNNYNKDLYKDVQCEPRINNIQRINNKIKKILYSAQGERQKTLESTTIQLKPIQTPLIINKKPQQTKEGSYWRQERKLEERSKSCLALKKNIVPSSELSQKVNDHLTKFNEKITQFQQQKRKFNINFKQSQQNEEKSSNQMESSNTKTIKNEMENTVFPHSPLTNILLQSDPVQEEGQVSPIFHSPYIGLKQLDSRNGQSRCIEQQQQVQMITRNMQMRRRQREAESQASPQQPSHQQTSRLMAMLSEQVQLDQQLQLAKKWFARCAVQSDWTLLQQLLSQRWREMNYEQIQNEFSITLDEEDPFYSYRPDQFELEDLVANYIICCRHWCEKVEGQWNSVKLKGQGCFEKLDRQGKGEIQIQDLVREINLSQAVFYRNRNLYLILQRLTHHGSKLTQDRLFTILASK